ncbi:hypothetical protein AK812_SmicGene9509 [Symbiodinium microadriaticum]|uniref:Uncharacterized protein n=1 Tax=Symbiodinium microadriaticum TaxID=2951 RepID=A0A1Q9EI59_SYMMI|nr:hypothetical protein AK812_SmicGene9509 [Symbiodinium microadriaticum]
MFTARLWKKWHGRPLHAVSEGQKQCNMEKPRPQCLFPHLEQKAQPEPQEQRAGGRSRLSRSQPSLRCTMPDSEETLDPFSKWTVTEERRTSRPLLRKQRLSKSLSAAAVLSQGKPRPAADAHVHHAEGADGSLHGEGVADATSRRPSKEAYGGYAAFKARFDKQYAQQQRISCLALNRRQRVVAETLQAARDSWEPDNRLAAAAAAEAEEIARLFRTPAAQMASCSDLARPRVMESSEEPEAPQDVRSWAEQQARVRALAEPRPLPQQPEPPPAPSRSAAEQQRHCAELSQPRAGPLEPLPGTASWREELASRAAAMVPEEVQAARALLASMRSRPRSAPRRRPSSAQAAKPDEAVSEQLAELKSMVEEVLWVVLLQVRSSSGLGAALEERLGSLLTAQVGPALRPVAKRLLGPGEGLPRRLRAEFPKLARHLGFRESEDPEPLPTLWQQEEVSVHLAKVRESRDELLSMDLTKDAILRLADLKVR